VQWTLAHAAAAWALVQVIEFAVGTFHWPEPLIRGAAAAAVSGRSTRCVDLTIDPMRRDTWPREGVAH